MVGAAPHPLPSLLLWLLGVDSRLRQQIDLLSFNIIRFNTHAVCGVRVCTCVRVYVAA